MILSASQKDPATGEEKLQVIMVDGAAPGWKLS
jgi:hypothetical protein